ncbi:MAG: LCP family protein, partial [Solirubrobacterales bacterium]|nr:LCP family protein [Solirubrobacterales bacterium]
MPDERHSRSSVDDPPYRVYRAGGRSTDYEIPPPEQRPAGDGGRAAGGGARGAGGSRARGTAPPYRVYRGRRRILNALLGPGEEHELPAETRPRRTRPPWRRREGARVRPRKKLTPGRVLKYLALAVVGWLLLSVVLFIISAQTQQVPLPSSASAALTPGGNMLTSANTILILGTDQRPRTGPGSKEPGANYNVAGSHSDTIMLWRVGGGVSRRLSIPRDTVAQIPGHGVGKINAGFAIGGPALAIKTVEHFTGIKIN